MDDEKQLRRAEDDPGIIPCKKLKTDVPLVSGEQAPKIGPFPDVANGRGDIESATDGADSSHRDTKSPSHELDDMQGSSGNSSNVENGDATEDDSGNISDSSSHASSGDWQRRPTGIIAWVHTQMMSGVDPRKILRYLIPNISHVPQTISDLSLWQLIVSILSEPQRRPKLQHINTMHDAVDLISKAKNILVLTGAGVSVSCGIPDFRSRDGIYARLAVDFPDLPDPQAMFDISYFTKDPRPFFKFAKEIYPGQFKPSRSHRFISLLQKTGRLLRNYTQNIDTLEQVAGISKVIQCHGSFATASCLKCHHKVDCEVIRKDIFNQHVPHCPQCSDEEELAIMKPDIVFFGESLPEHFHRQMSKDKDEADLLIVIGSSLKVRPVALIPSSLPDHIPQILINREPLPHVEFDVELLGDGDVIVGEICKRLGSEFSALGEETNPLVEIDELPKESPEKTRLPSNESNEGSSSKSDSGRSSQDDDAAAEPQDTITDSLDKPQHTSSSNVSPSTDTTSHTSKVPSDANVKETDCGGCENVIENAKDAKQNTHSDTTPDLSLDAPPLEVEKCSNIVKQEARSGDNKCHARESLDKKNTDTDCMLDHRRSTDALSNERQDGQVWAVEEDGEINNKCEKRKMWRSRWKQSVSKRLPGGTFYYNGKNRYIFPGAEIAPEEDDDDDDDDSELSDFDPDSNADGKSSDEESDDAPPVGKSFGPGGLSSTKRDLRTSSTIHSLQQSFLHSCHDHDHEPCTVIHVDHDDEVEGTSECSRTKDETADKDSQSQPGSTKKRDAVDTDGEGEGASAVVSNHLKCPDYRSDAVEVTHEESTPNQRDSIFPDELHDLVMETASTEPKQADSRSHSPLPPDLHKILANDPPHPQHPPHPLAKSDSEVPDTDQILCLPSSSLLLPIGEYAAGDTNIKSSEDVGAVTDTQRE